MRFASNPRILVSAFRPLFVAIPKKTYYGTMAANVPTVKFNNGVEFPMFGLGTWKSKPGEVTQAVKDAIDAGYRHIDCAFYYLNEAEVGQAIKEKIASGVVKREELFVTSKLWSTFLRPDLVEPSLKESLKNLGLDYLDLYLIHWPCALREGGPFLPKLDDHPILSHFSDVDYVDTWKALEAACRKGLTKSIGVSNFARKQLDRILEIAAIKPVNNQVECHPYLNQKKLIEYCKSKDIVVTAYSPLGSPDRPWAKPDDPVLVEDPRIKAIAAKYNKSPAQVIFRYILQNGAVPIPKSVTKKRIEENIKVFDFELAPEDVAVIDTIDCNGRVCWFEEARGHPHWPFHPEFQ